MTFVSYAQNFEDVLLWRALGHVKHGRYLDIGAQDPVIDSVSLAFYNAGWRGIHVEAAAAYAAKLREARPDETVIQAAVSDKAGPMVFYEIPGTGLSTGNQEVAASHLVSGFENQSVVVPSIRLDQLLEMENRDIHWMKIDVEGMEGAVLRSWGDSAIRPWVLVIESTFPSSQEPTHQQWISEVLRRGYKEVYFDGLSRFFVHEERQALAKHFLSPPNVFDGFSVSRDHFASKGITQQSDAAAIEAAQQSEAAAKETALRYEARLETVKGDARQKIDDARAREQAAAAESVRLRADISAMVERLIDAQRNHRETITRLWVERHASEATLRREASEVVDKHEADVRALLASAQSDRLALVQAHATAIASLNEESRASRLQLSELIAREQAMRRQQDLELGHLRARAAEETERSSRSEHSLESQLTMQSSILPSARNPFLRAQSLVELLAWHDIEFVRCAYVTVLGRHPDPEGEALYTAMIRSGQSKLKVLQALRRSPEGRDHDPGIAGFDLALRQYRRSTIPGLGWIFRRMAGGRLEDNSTQLRKLENAIAVSRDVTALGLAESQAVQLAESQAVQAIITSFVGEFRAFRDEQAARTAEQSARTTAEAESAHKILTSFVGEFRAFRDEVATRSQTELNSVRALKTSFVNEFDALRSEQAMRTNELRDIINASVDSSYRGETSTPYTRTDDEDPALSRLGPTAARIVTHLRSSRSYAS